MSNINVINFKSYAKRNMCLLGSKGIYDVMLYDTFVMYAGIFNRLIVLG